MTRSTRSALLATVALGVAIAASAPHLAADYRLPASEYGKVSLASKQSLGDAADVVSSQENVFEPIRTKRRSGWFMTLWAASSAMNGSMTFEIPP